MTGLTVGEAMSDGVVTVPAGSTIGPAIDRVLRHGHTHLVVVDDTGSLLDIVSVHLLVTALMTRLVSRNQALAGVLADPVSVSPETDLGDAAGLMLDRSVDALGVVGPSGALVGVLTWSDIGRCAVGACRSRAERRGPE